MEVDCKCLEDIKQRKLNYYYKNRKSILLKQRQKYNIIVLDRYLVKRVFNEL